jgi:excisionase family DNA binding protein
MKYILTTQEAAEYVGIGINRIRELVKSGEIPAARSGRNFKIPRPLLEEWILEKARNGEQI